MHLGVLPTNLQGYKRSGNNQGSIRECQQEGRECKLKARGHLKSLWSSVRKTTSSFEMLQMCLGIIVTTYCSTIFKTHVFSLYSHLCINVSMYLYSYPSTQGISGLPVGDAGELIKMCLTMMIEWTQRYTWTPISCHQRAACRGHDRANVEITLAVVIEEILRCTRRPGLNPLRVAHGGHPCVNLEAVIGRLWRCTWWLGLKEFEDALVDHDRASLEMHLWDIMVWAWRP